ncbi:MULTISPECIES: hypothetical protein [Mycolicibacterium]|nr:MULTISPECIES: hypothetical protein [Mycolicibacterium]
MGATVTRRASNMRLRRSEHRNFAASGHREMSREIGVHGIRGNADVL